MKKYILLLALVSCAGEPKIPRLDPKVACEVKASALVQAALQQGLTCEEVKPELDLLVSLDPDCKEYFGKEKPVINCDSSQ